MDNVNGIMALLMGFAYVAPPGPVNVETARRGIANGFRAAVCLQLGALAGDIFYAALTFLGIGALVPHALLQIVLMPLGVGLLLYLGVASLHDGVRGLRADRRHTAGARVASVFLASRPYPTLRRTMLAGVGISVANPFAVAFWLSISGAVLPGTHHNPVIFLAGFFLGVFVWALGLPTIIWISRAALAGPIFHYVSVACGLVLITFGLVLCTSTLPVATIAHALT